jgi:hypothetical protein
MANDFVNMNQIAVFKNNKVLIEFNDNFQRAQLTPEDYEKLDKAKNIEETPRKTFSRIHDKYSGIDIVANDYSNGRGDNLVKLKLRLTAENAKLILDKIKSKNQDRKSTKITLENDLKAYEETGKYFKKEYDRFKQLYQEHQSKQNLSKEDFEKVSDKMNFCAMSFATAQSMYYATKQKLNLFNENVEVIFNEQKIAPSTIDGSEYSRVTTFKIEYNAKLNNPWTVYVENGKGIKETTSTGGSKIKTGTYTDKKLIRLFITEDEIQRIFQKVVDYSIEWETVNINAAIKDKNKVKDKEKTFSSSFNFLYSSFGINGFLSGNLPVLINSSISSFLRFKENILATA